MAGQRGLDPLLLAGGHTQDSLKYDPSLAVRTSLRNLKFDGRVLNIPLYALQSLPRLVALAAL